MRFIGFYNDWLGIEYTRDAMLRKSAIWLIYLLIVTFAIVVFAMPPSIPKWYFIHQDIFLLSISIMGLGVLSVLPSSGHAPLLTRSAILVAIGIAALIVYVGAWFILEHYPLSRDEALADLATDYFKHGRLGRAIPAVLAPIARPMMPLGTDGWIGSGWWVSSYLPGNAILRAAAAWAGDRWIAGPALLTVAAAALWASTRLLWPEKPEAATVVIVLALTSSQVLLMAMTAYAMTAHFALNAVWLWCFLRGGRTGHGSAMLIGFAAVGLHQLQFHLIFASGFVIWLYRTGQIQVAAAYCLALASSLVAWKIGYSYLLVGVLGVQTSPVVISQPLHSWILSISLRLLEWQPINSLARFIAWQNILLLPLVVLGWRSESDSLNRPNIFWAMRFSCAFGLFTMVYQAHGFGYRYLHHLLPCFYLLAGEGWVRWNARHPQAPLEASILAGSAAVAVGITIPICCWMSHAFVHPYATAYRIVKSAPADVVLVDARDAAFVQDIVRIDDRLSRPFLLDLAETDARQLVALCHRQRVMIFDRNQSRALGVLAPLGPEEPAFAFSSRRLLLRNLHCGIPVPLPS